MAEQQIRVRASRSTQELEIEGDPASVRAWWDELFPLICGTSLAPNGERSISPLNASSPDAVEASTPETFGEFYHRLVPEITDIDRVLAAAYFNQLKAADRTFTTRAANDLLVEQGIRVSNPSMCVRRLVEGKRAFRVAGGAFRVSESGAKHIAALTASQG